MVKSRDQNAGRSHYVLIDSSSFERVERFSNFGTTLTDQNSIEEEIETRLKSGNVCYHSVQNILSLSLLSKNININTLRKGDTDLDFYITTVQDE